MDLSRRDYLKFVGASSVIGTSGCLSQFEEATSFTANLALLNDNYTQSHSFERGMLESQKLEESLDILDQDVSFTIQGWFVEYNRNNTFSAEIPETSISGSVISIISSPNGEINGRSVNPLATDNLEDIVEPTVESIDGFSIDGDSSRNEYSTESLGMETNVLIYDAIVESEGYSLEATAHVGRVIKEDDIIICTGAHPRHVEEEFNIVQSSFNNLIHPADVPEGYRHD